MERTRLLIVFLVLWVQFTSAQSFKDKASNLGINYCYDTIYLFGGGVSTIDFNRDGYDDLSLSTNLGLKPQFYTGNGSGFTPVNWSIDDTSHHSSVIWVDYDNDEDYDLYITAYEYPNRLYENDGSFNFTDVTSSAGLPLDAMLTVGSVWGDLDHDGYLDVYIYNYDLVDHTNYFYRNQGDGTFEDETTNWKISNGKITTLGAAFFDYDGDSNIDLFVANDSRSGDETNYMYWNDNLQNCADHTVSSGMNIPIFSMNAGIGDFDRDGDFDIYVTNNFPELAYLWQKHYAGAFYINEANKYEVEYTGVSWGGNFFDYDNDMDLDLYVCNSWTGETNKNALFENSMPNEYFTEINGDGREKDTITSWCNAIIDYNNDGQCDIITTSVCPYDYFIWKNETNNSNNYIKIKLKGDVSNADAIGSIIEVVSGGISQFKFTQCGEAFVAQNSYQHHFGLADESTVDTIRVTFPSGIVGHIYDTSVNIVVTVDEADFALAHTNLLLKEVDGILQWSWTGSQHPDHLILERKQGLAPFEEIMKLDFAESGIAHIPAFNPISSNTIYRLKAMESGVMKIYSNALNISNDLHSISTFPTIISQNKSFNIEWFSHFSENILLELITTQGVEITRESFTTSVGKNSFTQSTGLSPGVYFIRLKLADSPSFVLSRIVVI